MQPLRPQGHLAPPRLTTMWPISPAAPRPSQGLPSRTRPPPTPVPQKTPIRLWNSRPAPRWNSASVATWTSLPTRTSVPSASFKRLASGKLPSQPGRLRAPETTPVFSSASPGEPTPTPSSAAVSTPACSAASRSAAAISSATSCGPPLVGVGRRDFAPDLAAGVDDRGLDLRPAEVDAAAQFTPVMGRWATSAADPIGRRRSGKLRSDGRSSGGGGSGGRSGAGMSATTAGCAAPADRPPRRPRRLLHPLPGRGRGAGGARRGAADDRRRHAAGARLLADPGARGADRDRRRLLPQPQHDDRRPRAGRDRRPHDVRQRLLRRRRRATASTIPSSRSPSRASPRRGRSRSAPTAGSGSTASSPAGSRSASAA